MPILKKTDRSIGTVMEMLDDTKHRHLMSKEEKEAKINFGKQIKALSVIDIGPSPIAQLVIDAQRSSLELAERFRPQIISALEAQKALLDATRPALEANQKMIQAFKPYEGQFSRIAEIASMLARDLVPRLPDLAQWKTELLGEQNTVAAEHIRALRDSFKEAASGISISSFEHSAIVEPIFPLPIERTTHLTDEEKDDIAERAAQKMMEKVEEKLLSQASQPTPPLPLPVKTEVAPRPVSKKKVIQWENLVIDSHQATLRYKNNKALEITLGTQVVKWLTCVIEKKGEVAEYVEVALAIGHISEKQNKTNNEVGRNVQLVKKRVVTLLRKAGMTKKEIDQMIITKDGFGFAVRKIEAAQKPHK